MNTDETQSYTMEIQTLQCNAEITYLLWRGSGSLAGGFFNFLGGTRGGTDIPRRRLWLWSCKGL